MSISGLGRDSGLESVFRRTRNWPGMGGSGIGIGPEWTTAGADYSRVNKNKS